MNNETQEATQIESTPASEAQPQSEAPSNEAVSVEQPTGLSQYERTVAKGLRDIATIDEKLAAISAERDELNASRAGIINLVKAFEPVLGRKLINEPDAPAAGSGKPRTQNARKLSDVIVETFHAADTALNAAQVTEGVKERGFIFGGTDRSTYQRIHGEFRKLVEAKILQKVSSGHYGLVDPTNEAQSAPEAESSENAPAAAEQAASEQPEAQSA